MKHLQNLTLFSLLFLISCQKNENANDSQKLLKVHYLGDTLINNMHTFFEVTKVIIDSVSQIGFYLTSNHNFISNDTEIYSLSIEYENKDKIKFLDSRSKGDTLLYGSLLSTFNNGDIIKFNLQNKENYYWNPEKDSQFNFFGWIKYHTYSSLHDPKIENLKIGENYVVFKFGDIGNERIGWLNIVYLDTLCYIKEGFYNAKADENLIVGKK